MRFYLMILFLALTFSCKTESTPPGNTNVNTNSSSKTTIPTYGYEVVNTYKHDPKAFTQGLVYFNDSLYESTGLKALM